MSQHGHHHHYVMRSIPFSSPVLGKTGGIISCFRKHQQACAKCRCPGRMTCASSSSSPQIANNGNTNGNTNRRVTNSAKDQPLQLHHGAPPPKALGQLTRGHERSDQTAVSPAMLQSSQSALESRSQASACDPSAAVARNTPSPWVPPV